jgi:hypothetical protein
MVCELPSVFDEQVVTSRKQHECCECFRPIMKGIKYVRSTGKWNGEWQSFVTCLRCNDLRQKVTKAHNLRYEDCLGFGELMEYLHECQR